MDRGVHAARHLRYPCELYYPGVTFLMKYFAPSIA